MTLLAKTTTVCVLTFLSHFVYSQTSWQDNFTDSNFTKNPAWEGDTASFVVDHQYKLQLDADPTTAERHLATPSKIGLQAVWSFLVEMDFNPSANNFATVYIMSSTATSGPITSGYFIRVGGSSDDQISLFKKDGNSTQLLVQSQAGFVDASAINTRIKVERDSNHRWQLLADSLGGHNYKLIGSAVDSSFKTSSFFSLQCHFTATRADKFRFDDITATGFEFADLSGPFITKTTIANSQFVQLEFNEDLDSASAIKTTNYRINQGSSPINKVLWQNADPRVVQLELAVPLANAQPVELFIEEVEDRFANEMQDTTYTMPFYQPTYRDVVLNEIFADPTPTIQLPDIEYLELANNTANNLEITGWKLVIETDTFLLPDFEFNARAFKLIVSQSAPNNYDSLNPIKLNLGSTWLKNSGENVLLLNQQNQIIDAIAFSTSWHGNSVFAQGGWSLEQIDQTLPCSSALNWATSLNNTGGTPGYANNNHLPIAPKVCQFKYVLWKTNTLVELHFTTALLRNTLPAVTSNLSIDSVFSNPLRSNVLSIQFAETIKENTQLFIPQAASCQGTVLQDTVVLSPPTAPDTATVILNEILFNADETNAEYIELWNTSSACYVLSDFIISKFQNNVLAESAKLSEDSILLLPNAYLLLTENANQVCNHYTCGQPRTILNIESLPSLPNNEAAIALATLNQHILEQVNYHEDWHHPSINNPQNVSLERIHPHLKSTTATAWHSASTASRYGTPGRQNSQFRASSTTTKQVWLAGKTISPNNDGLNDLLIIHYNLPTGAVLNADIFALDGHHIQHLTANQIASPKGIITWDGSASSGHQPTTGVYIILAEWFTPTGEKGVMKLNFALQK